MQDQMNTGTGGDVLSATLSAAEQDQRTVDEQRRSMAPLLDGMLFYESVRHDDDRGSVTELYDPRWGWHPDPLVFSYVFTIRPGMVKGWGLHKQHEDRYFVLSGELELVLFDPRPESSTCGKICKVYLSGNRPRLVNVPKFVWHADRNIGSSDVVVVNFPTIQYDHSNPDKYRLPIDTDLIPYSFGDAKGW
ncbi:dTDP-4-dehydrorhamnose 3,5-epimerase family protein [Sinorhizobium sp. GL28]|uniref:polysaccharide biosynthesis C-terminal domain-containing protein n=1 Tax=Sinorhizobium sp. GL28 TaxID=1358418 RepID=UPI00072BB610|nr:dTDP-4-dehydrorhamnose 3,5-epimerase family protein [Sinorhizobium sp. GL28]KSV88327.1 dTDP-4-dehydrorhamnose 3,5-epimerase [Sinorhizobium sp. GL28]